MNDTTLKYDLGGIGRYKNGVKTINIDKSLYPDITADITASAKQLNLHLEPESVNMFTCIHTFEHLDPIEAVDSLMYWRTFLAPKGRIVIVVPDLRQIAKDMIDLEVSEEIAITIIFNRSPYQEVPFWMQHKYGWTESTLKKKMEDVGYIDVKRLQGWTPDYVFECSLYGFKETQGTYAIPNLIMEGYNR